MNNPHHARLESFRIINLNAPKIPISRNLTAQVPIVRDNDTVRRIEQVLNRYTLLLFFSDAMELVAFIDKVHC